MTDLIPLDLGEKIQAATRVIDEKVQSLSITSPDTLIHAGHVLGEVKARLKRLDELKDEHIKPVKDKIKEADNWFKMMRAPFEKMEMFIKAKIEEWDTLQRKIAREEQERREAEAEEARKLAEEEAKKIAELAKETGNPVPPPAIIPVVEPIPVEIPKTQVHTANGTVHTKLIWTWEVVDEVAIPREYLEVANSKLTSAVRSGIREIPGVRIYQKTSVSI